MAPKPQRKKPLKRGKTKPTLPVREEEEPLNMESMGHPEIYPLVLTTMTQEIFDCRVDEDVTDDQPYKLIRKEDILADFENRAAVSDFYPVKKIVQVSTESFFISWYYLKTFMVHDHKSWRNC